MEDVDTLPISEHDDHGLMLEHVFGDEHDLMFLDSYFAEAFLGRDAMETF